MTKLKMLYATITGAIVLLIAVVSGSIGAYFARRKGTKEISARDDEIRRQQAELNKDAAKAALDKLRNDIEGINRKAKDASNNPANTIRNFIK